MIRNSLYPDLDPVHIVGRIRIQLNGSETLFTIRSLQARGGRIHRSKSRASPVRELPGREVEGSGISGKSNAIQPGCGPWDIFIWFFFIWYKIAYFYILENLDDKDIEGQDDSFAVSTVVTSTRHLAEFDSSPHK